MSAVWEGLKRVFSGKTLWATGLAMAVLEVILTVVCLASFWYGAHYGSNVNNFKLNGFPTPCTSSVASAALAFLVMVFFSCLILIPAHMCYLSPAVDDIGDKLVGWIPSRIRPSLKRTVLIFANFNTLAYFISFVIMAGALPPCWEKDGVSGEGNIGAPANTSFSGSDNIGSWGPGVGWTICVITFCVIGLPYSATSIGIYFRSDAQDAPIPQRRPRPGDKEMTSQSSAIDYRGSVAM